jgi:hypothetical protein
MKLRRRRLFARVNAGSKPVSRHRTGYVSPWRLRSATHARFQLLIHIICGPAGSTPLSQRYPTLDLVGGGQATCELLTPCGHLTRFT